MTRILIADDHQVVRSGLRAILEAQQNWEVVAEAADGKEAILKAIETKPDVAVLDYSLPLVNGIEATRQIRTRLPRTEVLIFTMHDNEKVIEELVKAGARGYLLKSDARRDLMAAWSTPNEVVRLEVWLCHRGGLQWRGRDTNRKRSLRSCGRLMF